MPSPLQRLIDGFAAFRAAYVESGDDRFARLVREGQSPRVLVVACSDSRVDPAIVTRCDPGDLFVVRNVAALVPPCEHDGHHHGTSAAIEFGIKALGVEHVVVLGHGLCGGVRALARGCPAEDGYEFIADWMNLARDARRTVLSVLADCPEGERNRVLEQAVIVLSLENLLTFPWVRERVEAGRLSLHGWYFDLEQAALHAFDGRRGDFVPVNGAVPPAAHLLPSGSPPCACHTGFIFRRAAARRAVGREADLDVLETA